MREENGGKDPLLESALRKASGNTIFTGIRTLSAAETIIDTSGGRLVYIDSPLEDRYKRSLLRAREDHVSFDEFSAQDEAEHSGASGIDTSLLAIKAISSRLIINNSTLDEYLRQVDELITKR